MSKMGQYVFEKQEDAINMTREEFIEKYGHDSDEILDELYNIGYNEVYDYEYSP